MTFAVQTKQLYTSENRVVAVLDSSSFSRVPELLCYLLHLGTVCLLSRCTLCAHKLLEH